MSTMTYLSKIAADWALRCFGGPHVINLGLRALRTVEEAIELCQALDVPADKVLQVVRNVYSKPPGRASQELGGVLLTAVILAEAMHKDAEELLARELRRVLDKPADHYTKRNQAKVDLGLDVSIGDVASAEQYPEYARPMGHGLISGVDQPWPGDDPAPGG